MANEITPLGLKDKLILFVIFVCLFTALSLSIILPVLYTIILLNFFLFFVLILFFCIYLERKGEGAAKPPKKFLSVAVIVTVFNAMRTIGPCIESIKKMRFGKKVEIVVVDDGSTDGSREYLGKVKGIKFVALKKNAGKAVAFNTGLANTRAEFVACIDADTYPESDVFLKTMGYFEDPKVGAVTCLILPDKKRSLVQKVQFFEYALGFGFWSNILSTINSMTMIPGPMTIFRKKVFDEHGGYEAGNLTEDMEMGLRLQKHGYKIKSCYEARAFTDIPDTWGKLFKQRDRWQRGRVFNLMKYKSLFFNRKNVDLGFFSLPYLFAMELVSVMLLLRVAFLAVESISQTIFIESNLIGLSMPFAFVLKDIILSSAMIFFAFSYVLVFLFFYVGLRMVNYKLVWGDIPAVLINIVLYPLVIGLLYLRSFIKEMVGVRAKWVRVST